MSEQITIQLADGEAPAYLARPSGEGRFPAVLFYMDALGLRQTLMDMADRLAKRGYVVLLPELYYRSGKYEPFDGAQVFGGSESERERCMSMVKALEVDAIMRDTEACLKWLAARPDVKAGAIGTVGYCMGGGFSVAAAVHFPTSIGAALSFHGGRFLTEPKTPDLLAKKVRAAVYLGVAENDQQHDAAVSEKLEEALTHAGVPHKIEVYEGAAHGFAVPDLPVFDAEASEKHCEQMVAWLSEHLG